MLGRLSGRYGQRGTWLMLVGVVYVAFGVGIFVEPAEQRSWVVYQYLPDWLEALLWAATGAVAIWQGHRGAGRDDWLGHVALYLGPASRAVSFTLSWLVYLTSEVLVSVGAADNTTGYDRGWYAALIWLMMSAMLALAASWPNPAPLIPRPPGGTTDEH